MSEDASQRTTPLFVLMQRTAAGVNGGVLSGRGAEECI